MPVFSPTYVNSVLPAVALGRGVSSRENPELSSGKTLFFCRHGFEQPLHLFELVRHFCGEVVELGIVFRDVVELPIVAGLEVGQLARRQEPRGSGRRGRRDPAVVVDRAIADHLEILGVAFRRRVGVRLVEGVGHAHPFDRLLRDAVDCRRRLDARSLENGRNDIDDVVELTADSANVIDMVGPGNSQTLTRAAEMRRHLLGPFEGRVERP